MTVNWYSTSRVNALAAYDWIYNDLKSEERRAILVPFLKHIHDMQPRLLLTSAKLYQTMSNTTHGRGLSIHFS